MSTSEYTDALREAQEILAQLPLPDNGRVSVHFGGEPRVPEIDVYNVQPGDLAAAADTFPGATTRYDDDDVLRHVTVPVGSFTVTFYRR